MPMIPAFCDTCHTAFPSGFLVENCVNLTLTGNKSGPCPKCGGMGSIPDGVFNVFDSVIEIIDAPRKTIEQLKSFIDFLNSAQNKSIDKDSLTQKIKEDMPELSGITSFLPKTRNELYAFIALLISFLTLIVSCNDKASVNNITINNIVNETLQLDTSKQKNNAPIRFSTPSRNEACPCNSGDKYKNCCGEII